MELGWRWLCVTVITLASLLKLGEGQLGVQCWACPYMKFVNVTCKAHERYISEIPVTDTFCSGVANSPPLKAELCNKFPSGYSILCERRTQPREVQCSNSACPLEPAHQTGNDAIARHAPDFFLVVMAAVAALRTTTVQ